MNSEPLITIVTITYNAAGTVARTLESVASQDFTDYEHVIVDGASTDATLRLVESAPGKERRRVLSEPDNGLYDAMNKGIGLAKGNISYSLMPAINFTPLSRSAKLPLR